MFSSGFSVSKVKPQLKMAAQRITLVINKKTTVNKSKKKEIAKLLAEGKEEKASIKVKDRAVGTENVKSALLAASCSLARSPHRPSDRA
jgi:hypothetical protein